MRFYYRERLQTAAEKIAANRNECPAKPIRAFRKLLFQERRDWSRPGAPCVGWKRGELLELSMSLITDGDWRSEWGDVGYYIAQTWNWLWWLYRQITPVDVIERAVEKFEERAGFETRPTHCGACAIGAGRCGRS
jgi:hypothetical protein